MTTDASSMTTDTTYMTNENIPNYCNFGVIGNGDIYAPSNYIFKRTLGADSADTHDNIDSVCDLLADVTDFISVPGQTTCIKTDPIDTSYNPYATKSNSTVASHEAVQNTIHTLCEGNSLYNVFANVANFAPMCLAVNDMLYAKKCNFLTAGKIRANFQTNLFLKFRSPTAPTGHASYYSTLTSAGYVGGNKAVTIGSSLITTGKFQRDSVVQPYYYKTTSGKYYVMKNGDIAFQGTGNTASALWLKMRCVDGAAGTVISNKYIPAEYTMYNENQTNDIEKMIKAIEYGTTNKHIGPYFDAVNSWGAFRCLNGTPTNITDPTHMSINGKVDLYIKMPLPQGYTDVVDNGVLQNHNKLLNFASATDDSGGTGSNGTTNDNGTTNGSKPPQTTPPNGHPLGGSNTTTWVLVIFGVFVVSLCAFLLYKWRSKISHRAGPGNLAGSAPSGPGVKRVLGRPEPSA